MRRRLALLGAAAAAVALTSCGGGSSRDQVQSYLKRANAIETRSAPAFKRANALYASFSAGRLQFRDAGAKLAGAEASIRSARGQVAKLSPPAEAAELQRRLLRVYDLNLELAGETTALARYTPAAAGAVRPLAAAGKRLSAGLRASAGKVAQQQALRAYAASLARASAALGRLQPPPILAPTHEAELARLSSVSRLALRLGHAIGAGDAQQVAALLLRFRKAGLASTGSAALADRALRAYDRRYRSISAAATDLRREELRLQAKLG